MVVPYALAGGLVFATLLLPPRFASGSTLVLAAATMALIGLAALVAPWRRLPA